jgi:hypothetical protein
LVLPHFGRHQVASFPSHRREAPQARALKKIWGLKDAQSPGAIA